MSVREAINQPTAKSTGRLVIGLIISIIICFSAGGLGSLATSSSITGWYVEINKPTWNPPNWIFGPVWSTLFLMISVSAWLVWKSSGFEKAKLAFGVYAFHLLLNALWSIVFFGMQQMGWAFVEIVALWISIVATIVLFHRHSKLAAWLLIPYILWVSFASFLNYTIWQMNQA